MSKQINVPKLRFGEFEGNWTHCTLDDVSVCVTSGSRDWAKYYSVHGAKFVRMTNLPREGITLLIDDMKYVSIPEGGSEGQRSSLQEGDILISITAELGKIGIIPRAFGEAYINQHTALVRVDNSKVNSLFLAHNLATNSSNIKFNRLNDSGAKSGLNLSTIRRFDLLIPNKAKEQQKIASFLSKVDEKITLLTKKKEKLIEYKKGVMQQLFSGKWEEHDGQLTFIPPTLRFKADDGSEFPDWEEKTLSDLLTIGNGRDYKHLSEGSVPVFGTGGYMTSVDKHLHDGETVFIGRKGTINKPYMFNGKFWTVDTLFYTKDFKGVLPTFVYSIFQRINWSIYNEATGVPSLSKTTIGKIKIDLPSIKEQTKITDFLSSLDKKIELTGSELEKAKEWKKGLLQQMFV